VLYVGEEVPDGVVAAAGVAPFVVDPFRFAPVDLGKAYSGDTDSLVVVGDRIIYKFYRRLDEGMTVKQDRVVAMLNPAKAISELVIRRAKFKSAIADLKIAQYLWHESAVRAKNAEELYKSRAIAKEDLQAAILTRDKYQQETVQKQEAIYMAISEVEVAELQIKQHEIRNKIRLPFSRVKAIHKGSGDSVKATEPIMQLVSNNYLVAEGMIDIQNVSSRLWKGRVILEPTQEEPPLQQLRAHHGEITAVAVAKDGRFLSGSEDKTVCVWSRTSPKPLRQLRHTEPVRSLACTPPGTKGNWCAVGLADGSIHLWDLDKSDEAPVVVLRKHTDAVTALAVSPNGQWLASGGADNFIHLWALEGDPEKPVSYAKYAFVPQHGVDTNDQHHGAVTALHFTPQTRLISAGRDGNLRVWRLYEKGAKIEQKLEGRSNSIAQLGVDHAGKWMLYDKMGKELQVLSVDDGTYVCSLHNPQGAIPFETFAVFSPDKEGSLLLTAGASEGRLQVWRTPSEHDRGYEVRQLVPPDTDKSAATCAVFSHAAGAPAVPGAPAGEDTGAFVVTGSKAGYVYVWDVPTREQVEKHQIFDVRTPRISPALDNTRQNRLQIGLQNPVDPEHPDGRLTPGRPVTIVIE